MPKKFRHECVAVKQQAPVFYTRDTTMLDPEMYVIDYTFSYDFTMNDKNEVMFFINWQVVIDNLKGAKIVDYKFESVFRLYPIPGFLSSPFEEYMYILYQSFGHLQFAFGIALSSFRLQPLDEPDFFKYEDDFLSQLRHFAEEARPYFGFV